FGPHLRVRRPILAWRPGLPDLPSARRGRRAESSIRRVLLLRLRSQPPPPRGPDVPTSHPDTTSAPGLTRLPFRIRTLPRIHSPTRLPIPPHERVAAPAEPRIRIPTQRLPCLSFLSFGYRRARAWVIRLQSERAFFGLRARSAG